MKEKFILIFCVVLLCLCGLLFLSQNSLATNKNSWEYTSLSCSCGSFNEKIPLSEMNKLGQEGWEMVDILPAAENRSMSTICFKRKKQ